jgi:hypothetical protein
MLIKHCFYDSLYHQKIDINITEKKRACNSGSFFEFLGLFQDQFVATDYMIAFADCYEINSMMLSFK